MWLNPCQPTLTESMSAYLPQTTSLYPKRWSGLLTDLATLESEWKALGFSHSKTTQGEEKQRESWPGNPQQQAVSGMASCQLPCSPGSHKHLLPTREKCLDPKSRKERITLPREEQGTPGKARGGLTAVSEEWQQLLWDLRTGLSPHQRANLKHSECGFSLLCPQ